MSVTVGCDTVLTVDTKLPPSCNFLVSESFKIAIEVYNRWRISLKRLLNKQTNKVRLKSFFALLIKRIKSGTNLHRAMPRR